MATIVDSKTGDIWPHQWVNAALQKIRAEAIEDLRARDAANGIGPDGQVYRMQERSVTNAKGETIPSDSVAVIDQNLSAMKHTGRETRLLTQKRFAAFCDEPQDLDAFIASYKDPAVVKRRAAVDAEAEAIEATLKAPPKATPKPTAKISGGTKKTPDMTADTGAKTEAKTGEPKSDK